MLSQFGPSTLLAIGLGAVLAVVAFVPVVAVRYRRAGRLRPVDLVLLLMIAVYAVALWTYTLVPLPSGQYTCAGVNLRPFAVIDDIRARGGSLLRNRALLQAGFNVVLFMPLGFFLRVVWRRGVVIATLVGFATTLAIELTQLTGLWGLYPCAFRVFDVDDLILNTAGALLGSLVAVPVAAMLLKRRPAPRATEVTFGRRLVGMVADLLATTFVGFAIVITYRAIALYLVGVPFENLPPAVDQALVFWPPFLLEAWWVLARGRTLGEEIVQLEPVAVARGVWVSRALKFVFGVGGWLILQGGPVEVPLLGLVFAVVTLAMAWRSRDHRGLSHTVAGMDLRIEHASGE